VVYYVSKITPDLIGYRRLKVKALDDPEGGDLPPTTVSGTFLVLATAVAPATWSDHKALRGAQLVDRMGNVLVYRGTFYLPNARADALFDRASRMLEEPKPDFPKVESLLTEGLALRPNDFSGWMMIGNLHLLRADREGALALIKRHATWPRRARCASCLKIRSAWSQLGPSTPSRRCVTLASSELRRF
jgi:hypothetical protein